MSIRVLPARHLMGRIRKDSMRPYPLHFRSPTRASGRAELIPKNLDIRAFSKWSKCSRKYSGILAVLEHIFLGFKWLAAATVTKVVGLSATVRIPHSRELGTILGSRR
jgi:hypothetical protein